jgi:SAM-dependent methyltransferase
LISTNNFPETADIETSSEDYASRFTGAIGDWLLKVQEKATLHMLSPYPGATVLDVGGGHGQITSALIENGYHTTVLGSDEICKKRIQAFVDQGLCKFDVGNVLDLPYPDRTFDVVISYRFLAHVSHWQKFLSELSRVADKAIIVDYPTVRSVNYIAPLLFNLKKGVERNTRPFICYQEAELLNYLHSLGMIQTDRYAQFFWPMVLHRMLKTPSLSSALEKFTQVLGLNYLLGSPVVLKMAKSIQ